MYSFFPVFFPSKTTFFASRAIISPSSGARIIRPVSITACFSIPVATSGASVTIHGVACHCMFDPMSARFASSWFRKGISDVPIENAWFVETSI